MPALRKKSPRRHNVAVVLCAGQGTRMGAPHNKVFLQLRGKPVIVYALEAFEAAREVDEIVVVAHPAEVTYCREEIVRRYELPKVKAIIPGGHSRHQSEECALQWLRPRIEAAQIGIILIHDGARPFLEPARVDDLVCVAQGSCGAMLASSMGEDEVILRTAADGRVREVYGPGELVRAQTPQAFEACALLAAYDAARACGFEGTDTAASFERAGRPVTIRCGQPTNIKLTTPDDLLRAEARIEG